MPMEYLSVTQRVSFPRVRWKKVGTVRAAVVRPTSMTDNETGRTSAHPGPRLLPNGHVHNVTELSAGWKDRPLDIHSVEWRLVEVAEALGLGGLPRR